MYKSFSALFSPLGYYETPTGLLFKFYDWKTFLRILASQALTYSVFSLGDVPMRPLGCFQDKKSPSRPLPELIFTDNDPQSTLYSGFNVQSDDWQQYMPELICRFVILWKSSYLHYRCSVSCLYEPDAGVIFSPFFQACEGKREASEEHQTREMWKAPSPTDLCFTRPKKAKK